MSNTQLCPCGSSLSLTECCLPVLQGKRAAQTAEALLRARYTAFTRAETSFIINTHHSKTRQEVKNEEVDDWAKHSEWLGLAIVKTQDGAANDEKGTVTFCVKYRPTKDGDPNKGKIIEHWEHSLFEKENGQWRFLDAQNVKPETIRREEPKVGRNDPCPCGSGKKHKKCCG